jgi:5,10-methylenetetrahydromethanopterin reductase
MEFGIALATTTESWRWVKRAEELGFDYAWFYDTQLLNPDVFIGMTQAAMHTERIQLGSGVLVPSNRIEPVTANAFASLNRIAPGRIHFGVGTGFTGRRTMGLKALKLADTRAYIERVQALLRGETARYELEGAERAIRFLNPEMQLINLDDEIPLHVSAMGRRSRRLTASLCAGWLNFSGRMDGALADIADMQSAWAEEGNAGQPYSTLFALGCVLAEGEAPDSHRSLAQAGPWASVFFHQLVEDTPAGAMKGRLPPAVEEALERYREVYLSYPEHERHLHNHRLHLMQVRDDERAFLSAEVMSALACFAAPAERLLEQLRALENAGYSQFCVQLVQGEELALEDWAELAQAYRAGG